MKGKTYLNFLFLFSLIFVLLSFSLASAKLPNDASNKIDFTAFQTSYKPSQSGGNISGSGTNTQLAVFNGESSLYSDSNLYWDGESLFTKNIELTAGMPYSQIVSGSGDMRIITDFKNLIEGGDELKLFSSCNMYDPCIILETQPNVGVGTRGDIRISPSGILNITSNTTGKCFTFQDGTTQCSASSGSGFYTDQVGNNLNKTANVTFDNVTTNNLYLSQQSTKEGMIYQNNSIVFHTYGINNLFIGGAGNLGLTGTTGGNMGFGKNVLKALTNGNRNMGIGVSAEQKVAGGSDNCAIGSAALFEVTSGNGNIGIGSDAGRAYSTKSNSIGIGLSAGYKDNNGFTSSNLDYCTSIGAYAQCNKSNSLILGGMRSFSALNVGIGTWMPEAKLVVQNIPEDTVTLIFRLANTSGNPTATNPNRTLIFDVTTSGNTTVYQRLNIYGNDALTLYDNATVFNDMVAPLTVAHLGASAPSFDENQKAYAFADGATEQYAFVSLQLPHSYKEGTNVSCHLHVRPDGTLKLNATFEMNYTWFNIGESSAGTTTYTLSQNFSSGVAYKNTLYDFQNLDGAGKNMSSTILVKITRRSNAATDSYTGNVIVDFFDCHYEQDTLGSRGEYTK